MRAAKILYGIPLKNGFLDELVVRRELSDNFCLHNPFYDSFEGFPAWAKHSLTVHSLDKREFLYETEQLEEYSTHDSLWNAAQSQLIFEGKIHGYMRMYWAKKILEWSPNAAAAMQRAVFLNDKYSLDGHDSNGYAGCAWAIGGLHDRAWGERDVFGKVRYMNKQGCRRKFDVENYTAKYLK
jgi:deoxyribodipyrimidine photo-lyase